MLTPQEVSSRAFSKAVMGGYNMAMVDEFLDELTDDYTALYKENAALKAKMKVLVEKVEEYRATEDSMRATLLAAQKMADTIVREAEEKREQMMTQVEIDARLKIKCLQQETQAAEERLQQGQMEMARFIAAVREVCQQELRYLEALPQLEVTPVPELPVEEPHVDEIEEKVMAAFAAEPVEAVAEEEVEDLEKTVRFPLMDDTYPEGDPFADSMKLDDLQFGRNYSRDDS